MNRDQFPFATYRIQFNHEFGFADAHALVPYLSRLGVTHLYSSPVLRARKGSNHGYDVVDPTTLNPALGDESGFRALAQSLIAHGMGMILDIVPNHMAASDENPYWQHVLMYGRSSPFARWFDIDWRLPDAQMWGRVLVPVLGQPLQQVLQQEQLQLQWADGRFRIRYYERCFPLDPTTVARICKFGLKRLQEELPSGHAAIKELQSTTSRLADLPSRLVRARQKVELPIDEIEGLLSRLAQIVESSPRVRNWAEQTAVEFGKGASGCKRLRRLLDKQSYRLVHWRSASRVINYRRFFDITDLISIRQEDPEVFDATHHVIRRWVHEGLVDGLRIDHIDGLRDPQGYLEWVAEFSVNGDSADQRPYVFAEKILGHSEQLASEWPVEGTTGYEYLNQLESIFMVAQGYAEIEEAYRGMLRRPVFFQQVAAWGKRRILKSDLSAYVRRLAEMLHRIGEADQERQRLSVRSLADAIVETIVALPVYRTYVNGRQPRVSGDDRTYLESALVGARQSQRAATESLDFLKEVLLLENVESLAENQRQDRLNFIERFQQLSSPATAKGVEDTALYAYVPLVPRNEVGSDPQTPLRPALEWFHQHNQARRRHNPRSMLCVTTHDTKRSADVRSRLDVLTEIPRLWMGLIQHWRRRNRRFRSRVHRKMAPDAALEYLFYQTMVGIWPATNAQAEDQALPSSEVLTGLEQRVGQYMLKAAREAKLRTSWVDPDAEFEQALARFIRQLLSGESEVSNSFLMELQNLVARVARPGYWNALGRCLMQFTSPGTPDLYQGDELWNFSLVDPDNRRPVDFGIRLAYLDELTDRFDGPEDMRRKTVRDLVKNPESGQIKLYALRTLLLARRENPALFLHGDYRPLTATGLLSDHVIACARIRSDSAAVMVAPRWTTGLVDQPDQPPLGGDVWKDTQLQLPDKLAQFEWRCAMTREQVHGGSRLGLGEILKDFPIALLLPVSS